MVSFEGAVTSSREQAAPTVHELTAEVLELREKLDRTERALREARIELSQVKG